VPVADEINRSKPSLVNDLCRRPTGPHEVDRGF
jgi:hypothetical protein